ncbi:MAG: hypothetical protein HY778_05165 [Betaproteobacteria bacterium]|nr:hypothetical protein [Betaproteobacteria bacterium]
MNSQVVAGGRGWAWLVEGFRLFRRNPPLMTYLVFGYWMLLVTINLVPWVGAVVASLCVPALSMSVMNGCRSIRRGEAVDLGLLFSGFQRGLPALLTLGGLYLLCSLGVLGISAAMDGGALLASMLGGRPVTMDEESRDQTIAAVEVSLLLMLPVLMAFWFAAPLVAWERFPVGKALFFSFVASLRNWRAFLVYGLGVAFVSAVLPGILLGVFAATSKALFNIMAVAMLMPLVFIFVPTLFASFYASYCDVFSRSSEGAGVASDTDAAAD